MKKIVKLIDGKRVDFYKMDFYGVNSLFQYTVAEFLEDKPDINNVILDKCIMCIENGAFSECKTLDRVIVPSSVLVIREKAFDNCPSIKTVEIESEDTDVYCNSFEGSPLRYFYKPFRTNSVFVSREYPKEECEYVIDVKSMYDAYGSYNFKTMRKYSGFRQEYSQEFAKKLNKYGLRFSYSFVENIMTRYTSDGAEDYLENLDLRFFKNEVSPEVYSKIYLYRHYFDDHDKPKFDYGFLKFAGMLGCFSNEKWRTPDGKLTEFYRSQKASSFLAKLLKSGSITYDKCEHIFSALPSKIVCSQNFLNYISVKDENGRYDNFERLLKLEETYPDIFSTIVEHFDDAKKFRTVIDNNGKVKNIPYDEAFKRYLSFSLYGGIANEYPEYALLFAQKGMTKDCIKRAMQLIDYAGIKGIKKHILNKPLSEPTILEQIEKLKQENGELIEENSEQIQKIYDKMFTFEMLDKRNPINAIIGAYTSCCAVIDNTLYGARIARHTIIDDDVQNMVIKDKNGEIVAKGALYVNRDKGYAVFNDFEINYDYRKNEACGPGVYRDTEDSLQEIQRSKIFETLMRGMYEFMTEYNKQNTDVPITKICVGYGYNRLKEYCNRYETNENMLEVPDYFEDAKQKQAVLYDDDNMLDRLFYKRWLEDSEIVLKPKKEEIISWD